MASEGRDNVSVAQSLVASSVRKDVPDAQLTNVESNLKSLDGEEDPENPLNWNPAIKWLVIAQLSALSFVNPMASSMVAPTVEQTGQALGCDSSTLQAFAVSVFLIGYLAGGSVFAPLSELYGRRWPLEGSNWFFALMNVCCAFSPSFSMLIFLRFLVGVGASGCLVIGSGIVADLFRLEERGKVISISSIFPLIGPVIGPICGGFLAEGAGWKWVYWLLAILSAALGTFMLLFNRETNYQVILKRRALRLGNLLNSQNGSSSPNHAVRGAKEVKTAYIFLALARPIKLLCLSPVAFLLSIYLAVMYGLLYLLFATIAMVFVEQYGWSTGLTGLSFLGVGVGQIVGILVVRYVSDASVSRRTRANNGKFEPEMRLAPSIWFAWLIPVSFFIYGWTVDKKVHWIAPIIGMFPFGVGLMVVFALISTYVIDAFTEYAASAQACVTMTRSAVGGVLPLVAPAMYARLGLGWGNTLLGFLAAVLIVPGPALIFRYGGVLRQKYHVQL